MSSSKLKSPRVRKECTICKQSVVPLCGGRAEMQVLRQLIGLRLADQSRAAAACNHWQRLQRRRRPPAAAQPSRAFGGVATMTSLARGEKLTPAMRPSSVSSLDSASLSARTAWVRDSDSSSGIPWWMSRSWDAFFTPPSPTSFSTIHPSAIVEKCIECNEMNAAMSDEERRAAVLRFRVRVYG